MITTKTAIKQKVQSVVHGQEALDDYVSDRLKRIDFEHHSVESISGSDLAEYAARIHFCENANSDIFEDEELSAYEQSFGVRWENVDTFHIRCIDERRTDGCEGSSFLSFATAGCGCFCEKSEDRSLQHTIEEFLSIIKLWRKYNPNAQTITVEIEPHESCGAMRLALSMRFPDLQITSQLVDESAKNYALKLEQNLTSALYAESDLAHLHIDITTLPLASVFPKSGHCATCAVVSRLDVTGVNAQSSTTSFMLFDTLLGLPESPLSAFAITGEDTESDLHYLIDRVILAPIIATGDHGLAHFGSEFIFTPKLRTFKIYVEYNSIPDFGYLKDITLGLISKLKDKGIENQVQIIGIDRLS